MKPAVVCFEPLWELCPLPSQLENVVVEKLVLFIAGKGVSGPDVWLRSKRRDGSCDPGGPSVIAASPPTSALALPYHNRRQLKA
jgi:hypothetical protein